MSSFGSDGSIRCWICKKNGENRFFAGYAARKVHEDTVHAPKYSLGDYAMKDAEYSSYIKGYASTNTSFGTKSSDSGYLGNSDSIPSWKGKSCYKQMEQLRRRFGSQEQRTEQSIPVHHLPKCDQWINDREDFHQYETESCNIRLQKALGEIEEKKSVVKQLRADLDRTETTLIEYKGRETQLADQIEVSKSDMKSVLHELNKTKDAVEHERSQRMQIQQLLESRLNSQKMHIIKLREELDHERMMAKENENDKEALVQMERKVRQVEKELAIEKRLKLEAKKCQQECQSEVDQLVTENEEIRKRLRQCHHDLEQVQEEQTYLIADYNDMMDKKENADLAEQILEAQHLMQEKFNKEKAPLAQEIEKYQKQSELTDQKFKQILSELEKTRCQLANAESYRQDDIDRLLKEKECIKTDLKAKKTKLQSLESSNEQLISQVRAKERQIRSLQKANCNNQTIEHCNDTEVNQLNIKIKELEHLLQTERQISEKKAIVDPELISAMEENAKLKIELQQIQDEQLLKHEELENLKMENDQLSSSLRNFKKKLEQETSFLNDSKEERRKVEISLSEIAEDNSSLRDQIQQGQNEASLNVAQLSKLNNQNESLLEKLKLVNNQEEDLKKVYQELTEQKRNTESLLKEKHDLETSFEEEKKDLNEKLDQVLDANIDLEKECLKLEATIERHEETIKELNTTIKEEEDKNETYLLLTDENMTLRCDMERSRNEINVMTERIKQLKEDVEHKQTAVDEQVHLKGIIQKMEQELMAAERNAKLATEKIQQYENEMNSKEDRFKKENQLLTEELKQTNLQNIELQCEIKQKTMQTKELERKQQELDNVKGKLGAAKTNMDKLTNSFKDLESSCDKLAKELRSKKQEIKQSEAQQNDLFKKWKEHEKKCNSLAEKLAKTEEQVKLRESLRNGNDKQVSELQSKQEEIVKENMHHIEGAQLTICELQKVKEELQKENDQLRAQLAEIQKKISSQANQFESGNDMAKELEELRQIVKNNKGREEEIQKHNYEMMKKLDVEESLQKNLQAKLSNLKEELEAKKTEKINGETRIDSLQEEIRNWQRKFDDLASSLADTKANMQIMSDNSAKAKQNIQKENQDLKRELEKAKLLTREKEAENISLQKQNENYKQLSAMMEHREAEVKSLNEYIQNVDDKNSRLNIEVRKFERIVRELEDKVEMLESDMDECQQEKEICQTELEKQKEVARVLESTEKDLEKAYEDISELATEKKGLLIKCEQLQAQNAEITKQMKQQEKKQKSTQNIDSAPIKEENSAYEYESDFEEADEKSSRSDKTDNDDILPSSSDEDSDNEEEQCDENASEIEEVNFDDDDGDDFWDIAEASTKQQGIKELFSKTGVVDKITEDSSNIDVLEMKSDEKTAFEGEDMSSHEDIQTKKVVETGHIEDIEEDENITEDITVDEEDFLNDLDALEYFEEIEPLNEDEKVEKQADDMNSTKLVEEMDGEIETDKTATNKNDIETEKTKKNKKRVRFADEEGGNIEEHENITEDITVDEDSHFDELEYFEEVEPLDEGKELENQANDINGDMLVEDIDDEIETQKEVSATNQNDFETKKTKQNQKRATFADEEDDILTKFVANQQTKAKRPSKPSDRRVQMAAELGLDDEVDIDDLIADIEADNDSYDHVKSFTPKQDIKSSKQEEPNLTDSDSDSETGIKPRQSGLLFSPSTSPPRPNGRNMLLPPLGAGARSLPPLRGTEKPKF